METERITVWDRLGVAAIALLIAAFALGVVGTIASTANADDKFVAMRDSGSDEGPELEEEEDNSGPGNANDEDDTATGTTQGTGASVTATNDTATGTRTGQ
jgi:hypothetical protein